MININSTGSTNQQINTQLHIVSDSSWLSSDTFSPGWELLTFDDSAWVPARAPYPKLDGTYPPDFIPGTTGSFIWYDPFNQSYGGWEGVVSAYFRKEFTLDIHSTDIVTGLAKIQVDDDYELYINGVLAFENKDGGYANTIDYVDVAPYLRDGKNIFAIHAVDGPWNTPHDHYFEDVLVDMTINVEASGPITIYGTNRPDFIVGTKSDDVIFGRAGNDTIGGLSGNDSIDGGQGNDIIYDESGRNTLSGSDGDDHITGSGELHGGNGLDTLMGQAGNDRMEAGINDDELHGFQGVDTLVGGVGADILDGGIGSDTVDYSGSTQKVAFDMTNPAWNGAIGDANGDVFISIENVITTIFDDSVLGSNSADSIQTGNGNDYIEGRSGNDQIKSGAGKDIVDGGEGDDKIIAADGNDYLNAGLGSDFVSGGSGADVIISEDNDVLYGGTGNDVFIFLSATVVSSTNIADFNPKADKLDFSDWSITDWNDLTANHLMEDKEGNAIIYQIESRKMQIVSLGVSADVLTPDIFIL